MIEIRTTTEMAKPMVAVCREGNICLFMPADWDVNDALNFCEQDLMMMLHKRFKTLFADSEYPREFRMFGERLSIKPDSNCSWGSERYFERFLDT